MSAFLFGENAKRICSIQQLLEIGNRCGKLFMHIKSCAWIVRFGQKILQSTKL